MTPPRAFTAPRLAVLVLALALSAANAFAPRRPRAARRVRVGSFGLNEDADELPEVTDAKFGNLDDLPDLGDLCEEKKHKDPAGEDLTDRFLMAARALRGEFDPEDPDEDTDENSQLLHALVEEFPSLFSFTAVGKSGDDETRQELVEKLTTVVSHECDGAFVRVQVTERLGGRFASVRLTTTVQNPDMIQSVLEELRSVDKVKMAF